jgi:hypothetical protein
LGDKMVRELVRFLSYSSYLRIATNKRFLMFEGFILL